MGEQPKMRLLRSYSTPPAAACGAVAVIGNFDGVHRGHQHILGRARTLADARGASVAALFFEPHPRRYFAPDSPPFRLTTLRERLRLLAACGVDTAVALRFNAALAAMPAEEFVSQVLVQGLKVRHIVVGYDFAFGHRRAGNVQTLTQMGERHGFGVEVVAAVKSDGEIYSSNRIRAALRDGAVAHAAQLLGHWWQVSGRVRHGDARGRKLGFATANLDIGPLLAPRFGVYAVRVAEDGTASPRWRDGVANFGVRPTIGGGKPLLEAHLLDFTGDLYRRRLRVGFVDFIRPEQKFAGLEALMRQIAADCEAARAILADPANPADLFPPPGQSSS